MTRSFGTLVRDLATASTDLLRHELRLARIEAGSVAGSVAKGSALVAFGGVLLLLGTLAVATGFVLLAGDQWLPADRYWVGALLIVLVTGAFAAWLARRGVRHLRAEALLPDETLESLREDKEWLKRQLK